MTARSSTEVLIVGAGQAGLALSWHLTQRGVEHVLIERDSIAHEWRDGRWDSFTLVTPNWQCELPGFPYDGTDPHGFMRRSEVHDFLLRYAASFSPPVITGVEVVELTVAAAGGYLVRTTAGEWDAGAVVIATGGYHRPVIPPFAARLPATITQIHSSEYRNADSLPDGAVLVVGSGQSGAQIAEDLHLEGRKVVLALGGAPRVARFYRGRDCVDWLHDMGVYDLPVDAQAGGLAKRESTNHYVTGRDGGRDIDLRRFALEGMRLTGRLRDIDGSILHLAPTTEAALDHADSVAESIKDDIDRYIARRGIEAPVEHRPVPVWRPEREVTELDLAAEGVTSVVWSIGYRADYRWVRVGVFDGQGHPTHLRGVTAAAGLYFLGLPWLHTWGSGRFAAIARDADHLARHIAERAESSHGAQPVLAR